MKKTKNTTQLEEVKNLRKIVERGKNDMPHIHVHDLSLKTLKSS